MCVRIAKNSNWISCLALMRSAISRGANSVSVVGKFFRVSIIGGYLSHSVYLKYLKKTPLQYTARFDNVIVKVQAP